MDNYNASEEGSPPEQTTLDTVHDDSDQYNSPKKHSRDYSHKPGPTAASEAGQQKTWLKKKQPQQDVSKDIRVKDTYEDEQ